MSLYLWAFHTHDNPPPHKQQHQQNQDEANTIVVIDDSEDSDDDDADSISPAAASSSSSSSTPAARAAAAVDRGFKLRPPPTPASSHGSDERRRPGKTTVPESKSSKQRSPDEEQAWKEEEAEAEAETIRPVTGPDRDGGDIRFRKSNLFALANIKPDASALASEASFAALLGSGPSAPFLLAGLRRMGISTPTKIQAAAIPALLRGKEAVLHSYTGSGMYACGCGRFGS